MAIPHEPWLVALSIAIAIQGSFVGLSLAVGFESATGLRRRVALAGSALTLATGVWSMHFVGMLAASFPSAVDYLALPTLVSFLICVLVVGVGVYAALNLRMPKLRVGFGALAMGLGISTMHYVGMSAVHLAGPTYQEPPYVVASFVVAVAASAFALLALGGRPTKLRLFLGAIVLGLAISGMHYTAMAGMRLDPLCFDASRFVGAESALTRNTLALLVTVISFGVSGAFLLSLAPDVGPNAPQMATAGGPPVALSAAEIAAFAPRQANAPHTSLAPTAKIRVEKDGRPCDLALAEVYAIRADAHYTHVHDGEREYFCNEAIGALEAKLDAADFLRVHRSYIVRLDRVAKVKRVGEAAVAELECPVRCSIPVARGHYRELKTRIEELSALRSPAVRAMRQPG